MQEFREVAKQYPSIKSEEMIVDNTCMQLTGRPPSLRIETSCEAHFQFSALL